MPSYIGKATDAFFDAVSTGSSIIGDYNQKQAELSTRTKNYQLQAEITGELNRIKTDTHYENWNSEINQFFERIKSSMSDKDSPYYCRNNLQARMFDNILAQQQQDVSAHVSGMVIQEQQAEARVNINNGILNLKNLGYAGQELYDESKKLVDGGWSIKAYSREQYNQMLDQIFYDAYGSMYEQMFDKTWSEAIDRGDSWETVKNMMIDTAPQMMKTDGNNMPVAFDKEAYDTRIFENLERKFKAKQQDIWQQTEKKCSQLFDNVMDGRTAEVRNRARLEGRTYLDSLKNTGRISPDQLTKWTKYFQLEDYLSGNGKAASAKAAINKLDPKDAMNFFLNSIKRGDESDLGGPSTVYNSYELFKDKCMNELLKINPDYSYTELEQSCPTVMEYLEYAKKSLPPMMQDVVTSAETMLKACLGKEEYKDEINSVLDLTYDMLFEANISDFDAAQQKEYRDRIARAINSKYGNVLQKNKNYKWLKDEKNISAITNYKQGVFGQEKALAQAMHVRDNNPDIYYQDMYGNKKFWMGDDVQNGITLIENEERKMIANAIKYKTGKEIDPDKIPAAYESDGINDVNARNVYTVNGHDYYFTSKDGKHVTMYEKKTGTNPETGKAYEWEEAKTASQQEKYDSPRETAKRAVQDIDVTTVPPFEVPGSGMIPKTKYSQKQWDNMNSVQKKNIIMSLLEKYPEEMQAWLNQQPDKKKK